MKTSTYSSSTLRYVVAAVLVVGAFFGAYRFAIARGPLQAPQSGTAGLGGPASLAPDQSSPACACCGTGAPTADGITGEPVPGTAAVEGEVQRISVDLSKGYYEPNVITLAAGIPAEITFGQSSGCTAQVMSDDLGFAEDLTASPRTVRLPALEPGEYAFSCGMRMVFGKVVVE